MLTITRWLGPPARHIAVVRNVREVHMAIRSRNAAAERVGPGSDRQFGQPRARGLGLLLAVLSAATFVCSAALVAEGSPVGEPLRYVSNVPWYSP